MKNDFKILVSIFVVSICFAIVNVKADLHYYTIENQVVPGNNGGWMTWAVDINVEDAGGYHVLRDQNISRDMDVRMHNNMNLPVSDNVSRWKRMYKKNNVTFVTDNLDPANMQIGWGWHWMEFSTDLLHFGDTTIYYANWWLQREI